MNIKLEEYIRGSRVKLIVDDAPMTALSALTAAFVTACDAVEESCQDQPAPEIGRDFGRRVYDAAMSVLAEAAALRSADEPATPAYVQRLDAAVSVGETEEAKQKRKRRTKAEMEAARQAGDAPATAAEVREQVEVEQATETVVEAITSLTAEPEDVPLPFDVTSAEAESADDASPALSDVSTSDEPITDTELQRFCGRLAQHFGGAQKVFDLSKDFVPEGVFPRPTNIKDNAQRWAFIRHAEEQSGVKYHG